MEIKPNKNPVGFIPKFRKGEKVKHTRSEGTAICKSDSYVDINIGGIIREVVEIEGFDLTFNCDIFENTSDQQPIKKSNTMEWISTKDQLPESGLKVLGAQIYPEFECAVVYFNSASNGWCQDSEFTMCFHHENETIGNFTHWMPLPEPPIKS